MGISRRVALAGAGAIAAVCIAVTGAAAATASASPASLPGHPVAGCINGKTNRTVSQVYTSKIPACPKGSFSFSAASEDQLGTVNTQVQANASAISALQGAGALSGAYYSVAKYDVGDTNGGAIATVACKSTSDVAISGGVQTLALGTNGTSNNVPVSSSFPGRMDWSTNTPKPGRLDGWIVQFASQNASAPEKVKVWALCAPGLNVPVDQTFTESNS